MVDFIYFCIVLHFIFTGKRYGLLFYWCALSFQAPWFPSDGEKAVTVLLPLPVRREGTSGCSVPAPPAPAAPAAPAAAAGPAHAAQTRPSARGSSPCHFVSFF